MTGLPRRAFPCAECPWRRDVEPGQFTAARFAQLAASAGTSSPADFAGHMFGCHKGEPGTGTDLACAGWLAVAGREHLLVRLACARGDLPYEALRPGAGWPPLWSSYQEMAEQMGSA